MDGIRIAALLRIMHPVAPWHWPAFARKLAAGEGWMPPMFVVATLGSAFGSHAILEMFLGPNLPPLLEWVTWLTWCIVGLMATALAATQGTAHLWRFGFWGPMRPRWWFEVARLMWILTLLDVLIFGAIAAAAWKGVAGAPREVANLAFYALQPLFGAFMLCATAGYLLGWVRWLPFRGKAFWCVHYFYTIVAGIILMTMGGLLWQPQAAGIELAVVGILGVLGVALLAGGFVSIVKRWEQQEKRHATRGVTRGRPCKD